MIDSEQQKRNAAIDLLNQGWKAPMIEQVLGGDYVNKCYNCGKAATLFCDGWVDADTRSDGSIIMGTERTCDRAMCSNCAHSVGIKFMCPIGVESEDYCESCNAGLKKYGNHTAILRRNLRQTTKLRANQVES
jgi:hypothetical protein